MQITIQFQMIFIDLKSVNKNSFKPIIENSCNFRFPCFPTRAKFGPAYEIHTDSAPVKKLICRRTPDNGYAFIRITCSYYRHPIPEWINCMLCSRIIATTCKRGFENIFPKSRTDKFYFVYFNQRGHLVLFLNYFVPLKYIHIHRARLTHNSERTDDRVFT